MAVSNAKENTMLVRKVWYSSIREHGYYKCRAKCEGLYLFGFILIYKKVTEIDG